MRSLYNNRERKCASRCLNNLMRDGLTLEEALRAVPGVLALSDAADVAIGSPPHGVVLRFQRMRRGGTDRELKTGFTRGRN